jgi:hypothetical protein
MAMDAGEQLSTAAQEVACLEWANDVLKIRFAVCKGTTAVVCGLVSATYSVAVLLPCVHSERKPYATRTLAERIDADHRIQQLQYWKQWPAQREMA